jgi:hypothetical protein
MVRAASKISSSVRNDWLMRVLLLHAPLAAQTRQTRS